MKTALVGARKTLIIAAIGIASAIGLVGCSDSGDNTAMETTTVTVTSEVTVTKEAEKPFATCEEAKEAGRPKARRHDARFNPKLDKNNDGVICNETVSTESTTSSTTSTTPTSTTTASVEPTVEPDVDTRPQGLLHNPPTTRKPAPAPAPEPAPAPASAYYANCAAARAAGASPLYAGQPGYRSALDRDGDGVACE